MCVCVDKYGLYILVHTSLFGCVLDNLKCVQYSQSWDILFCNRGSRGGLQSAEIPLHSCTLYVQCVVTQGSLASITFTLVLPTVWRGSFMSTTHMTCITIETWLLNKYFTRHVEIHPCQQHSWCMHLFITLTHFELLRRHFIEMQFVDSRWRNLIWHW